MREYDDDDDDGEKKGDSLWKTKIKKGEKKTSIDFKY